jgi:hypothetical protein
MAAIPKYWHRKEFKDFDYLQYDITTKQLLQSTISFLKKELLEAQQAFQK